MTAQEFAEKMQACAENGNIEIAHIEADELLAEMLDTLASAHLEGEEAAATNAGLAHYENVGKWYA